MAFNLIHVQRGATEHVLGGKDAENRLEKLRERSITRSDMDTNKHIHISTQTSTRKHTNTNIKLSGKSSYRKGG